MIFIAHRGNTNGPNPSRENHPDYITTALRAGYDAEIDIWLISSDESLWLGHDEPQYEIQQQFLLQHKNNLWCHAKNKEALEYLLHLGMHTFWHQEDDFTLTSRAIVWAYPDKHTKTGIYVMPERNGTKIYANCMGICSDFVEKYRKQISDTQ